MKRMLVAYGITALIFLTLDGAWLTTMGPRLYRPALHDILGDGFRPAPAILFYIVYVAGIVGFAVLPAQLPGMALARGVGFGLVAYATYDLTNQATLRVWPVQITLADLTWGGFATGVSAALACLICGRLLRP